MMRKSVYWIVAAAGFCSVLLLGNLFVPSGMQMSARICLPEIVTVASAAEEADGGSISKLKVEPLHRAVRITWRASGSNCGPMTFEIHRSMVDPEGEYTVVTSIAWSEGVKKYKYLDKDIPVEENYYYKIEIPETEESFGPIKVRPPFSLPTT
jgi:hypothetical protein